MELLLRVKGKNDQTMPSKSAGYRPGIPQQPYTKWDTDKDEVEVDYKQMSDGRRVSWFSGKKGMVLKILLVIVIFSLGLIIGYVLRRSVHEVYINPKKCPYTDGYEGYSSDISQEIQQFINITSLEQNLKEYTKEVHMTGTSSNMILKETLKKQFRSYGLTVKEASYNVLLSYAEWEFPNVISLVDANDSVVYQTSYIGPQNNSQHPDLFVFYNAYAPKGDVTGGLVYANFGETSDFEFLKTKSVSCEGNIIIMRYGKIFRGIKVQNAADCGAAGVILYSDPAEVHEMHVGQDDVYPNGWWLANWDAQRGSIRLASGDPLTPGLPSIGGVASSQFYQGFFRISESDALLPTIPCQPIGYKHAQDIMSFLAGPMGNADFQGSLHHNVTYRVGPGFSGPREGWKVRLEVNNENELRNITNVLGILNGEEEPDRYIIVGSHYDSWTYGAVDPNSGTSVLMEVAKAFGVMKNKGWRPRRTIVFANWDGEEQGLIGSTEWVEENAKELSDRTVAYVNIDGIVRGNATFDMRCSPMLQGLFKNVTKQFPSIVPMEEGTMYDSWMKFMKPSLKTETVTDNELFSRIDSSSDQAAFVNILGVPSMFPRLIHNKNKVQVEVFPAYHTDSDEFQYMRKFVDPSFKGHETMAKIITEIVLQLSSVTKLPLDVRELAQGLSEDFNALSAAVKYSNQTDFLKYAISNFTQAADEFTNRFNSVSIESVLTTRSYNDRLMKVSQAFIHGEGLPGRPQYKNLVFSPSQSDVFGGASFAGIYDSYQKYENSDNNDPERNTLLAEVERQISLVILSVQSAQKILISDIAT